MKGRSLLMTVSCGPGSFHQLMENRRRQLLQSYEAFNSGKRTDSVVLSGAVADHIEGERPHRVDAELRLLDSRARGATSPTRS